MHCFVFPNHTTIPTPAELYHNYSLSLWLSVDPLSDKYPRVSSYVYCGNNPVRLVDVDGREIWIDGEDCNRYRYYKGYLYTENGERYTPESGSFLAEATYALDVLKETKTGQRLVETFEESDKNVTIINNLESYCDNPATDSKTGEFKSIDIFWNPNGTDLQTTTGITANPITDLGHELSHAYDNAKHIPGLLDLCTKGGTRSEWRAVYKENSMREDLGMPYRCGYAYVNNGLPYWVNMLNRKKEPYLPKSSEWIPSSICKKNEK